MGSRQKILIISMAVYYGGGESYLLNLEKLLSKKFDLTILTSSKILYKKTICNAIFVKKIRFIYFISILFQTIKFIIISKPNSIILNGPNEASLSYIIRYFGLETVAVKHTDFYENSNFYNKLKNKVIMNYLRNVTSIISVSSFVHKKIIDYNKKGLLQNKTYHFIPNWPDDSFIHVKNYPINDNNFHILIVARLVKYKGHLDLFDACRGLDNIVIHVVGSGPSLKDYINYTKGLRIIFHGFQENVKPFYQLCNLQVLPSYTEGGHPLCILEGLSVGIRCIGSNIPAIKEILDSDHTFELGNHKSIRNKILKIQKQKNVKQEIISDTSRNQYFGVFNKRKNIISKNYDLLKPINTNKSPKEKMISIIIPLYNDEKVIRRLIDYNITNLSAIDNIEVIFIDDGSSDNTLFKLKNCLTGINIKYKILEHKKNLGPAAARNNGVKACSGDLIAFLDSDDIWHPWKVDTQRKVFEDSKIQICACDHEFIDIKNINKFQKKIKKFDFNLTNISIINFIFRTQFVLPSLMIRKKVIDKFLFDEDLVYAEDFELWMRLLSSNQKIFKFKSKLVAIVKREKSPEFQGISDNITSMFSSITKILYSHFKNNNNKAQKFVILISIIFLQIRFLFRIFTRASKFINFYPFRN